MKVLAFEVKLGGLTSVISDLGQLKDAIKKTSEELANGPKIGSVEFLKLQKQLGALQEIQKQVTANTAALGREYAVAAENGSKSYNALSNELTNLKKVYKELSESDRQTDAGQAILGNIRALSKELGELDAAMKRNNDIGVRSYDELAAKLKELKGTYNSLSESEREADSGKALATNIQELDAELKNIAGTLKATAETGQRSYNELNEELKRLRDNFKNLSEEERNGAQGEELLKNIRDVNKELKQVDAQIKSSGEPGKGSYRALNAELVNLRAKFKELSEEERNSKFGQGMIKNIQALDKELKTIDASIGQYQRNVGDYKQALIGIGDIVAGGLITGGLQSLFSKAISYAQEAVMMTADFSRQISTVAAVSRASEGDIRLLEQAALDLGASTEYTAAQAAQLEIEYAKLGFTAPQILEVLPATLDAATVAQEDLGETAAVVGKTLRAFNMDVSEADKVVDIMAKAFSSSSLDLGKFETAIGNVGAAGKAVGLSLEEVTALLGVLVDSGVDAGSASTALRNIFLANASAGLTLDQALEKIGGSTDMLVASNEQYQKGAATQATILAQQTEKTKELTAELIASAGFAKESADIIRGDLKGSYEEFTSAVEGVQLAIGKRLEGAVSAFWRVTTEVLGVLTQLISGTGEWGKRVESLFGIIKASLPIMGALTLGVVASNAAIIMQAITTIPAWIAAQGRAIITTKAWTVAQKALNLVLRMNPFGIVITAITLIVSGITTAYQKSEKFRAILDGIGALAKEVFRIIAESVGAFAEGFNSIRSGDILGGMKAIGTGLKALNPVSLAITEGKRLGEAFNLGYADSLEKSAKEKNILEQKMSEIGEGVAALSYAMDKGMVKTIAGLKARKKELEQQLETLVIGSEKFNSVKKELTGIDAELKKLTQPPTAAKTISPFDELNKKLSEIKGKIQDYIVEGKDYSKLLSEYITLSQKAADAQEEFRTQVEGIIAASALAEGSVKQLSQTVADLRAEIEKAPADQTTALVEQLTAAEKKLEEAQDEIERFRQTAMDSARTNILEKDLKAELDAIKRAEQERVGALQSQELSEKEFLERKKQINLSADIATLEAQLRLYKEGTTERLKMENELAAARKELAEIEPGINLSGALEGVETEKNLRLQALQELGESEKQYQLQRTIIEKEATVEVLKTRLDLEKLTNAERLALTIELHDAELEAEKARNEKVLEGRRVLGETLTQVLTFSLDTAKQALEAYSEYQRSVSENRIAQIEAEYDKQIERAGGNANKIKAIEEQRNKEITKIQEEQFKRQKRMQIAMAAISGAQAIVSTLAAVPGPVDILTLGATRIIQMALVAATTAAQIAAMAGKSFAQGGFTGSSAAPPDRTGKRPVGIVHANEYVIPEAILSTPEGMQLALRAEYMRRKKRNSAPTLLGYYADGGFTPGLVVPSIPGPASVQSATGTARTELSEAQLDALGQKIGSYVYDAIYSGTIDATEETAMITERRERLTQKTG